MTCSRKSQKSESKTLKDKKLLTITENRLLDLQIIHAIEWTKILCPFFLLEIANRRLTWCTLQPLRWIQDNKVVNLQRYLAQDTIFCQKYGVLVLSRNINKKSFWNFLSTYFWTCTKRIRQTTALSNKTKDQKGYFGERLSDFAQIAIIVLKNVTINIKI